MLGDNHIADERGRRPQGHGIEPLDAFAGGERGWTDQGGDQPTIDLASYWRLALKYRFLILGCFLGALVIGATVTLLMTPIYTAEATLQIDREAARIIDSEDVTPSENMMQGEEFFQTQYGLLRSRSLAERVIESLGLASSNEALAAMGVEAPEAGGTAATQTARRRAAALKAIEDNLGISPVRGSRLVSVGYDNPDPVVAARIANGFAENFIQSNLDRKFQSSAYAREFLEERIAQTKERLEDAERQLVAYATTQQIINVGEPGESGSGTESLTSNNLVALNGALARTRAERVAAEERWRSARTSNLMTLPEVLQNLTIQRLTEQRALLDAEYQQKLSIYQPDYPEMVQLKARIDEADSQIATIAANIRASIRSQYEIAANQERSLQSQVAGLTGDVLDLRDRSIQYNILQRELDTTRTLYEALLQRYKEVGVTGGVTANNISIVDVATPPRKPSKPNMLLNMALAALLGLGLGVLAALIMEALDETLATPDDVEKKLGVPVLGVIPLLEKGESPAEALADIRSGFSEAYYSLRTALQFSTPDGAPSSLLVSSARPAEGKSTTAYAVALNLARVGKRVLLVDGDLRNPSMHRVVGVENERGMSNLLSGATELAAVVQPTRHENLFFIPCGPLPPNPAELWGGERLHQFLAEARTNFDHVVFDGPPVLGFADAPMLAAAVHGTVFVLESRGTRRGQARGALRRLQVGRARLLGAVLSKFSAKSTSYGGYDYAYDYHYGAQQDEDTARKGKRG
ncbi:MAG: polysaccharide biosynthesis tyrosine autokinase [Alphaproteobacteria bacterium]|nr:polysaccharide biosynthesis tyrosine autokinase [Alphaproteobacteria bacterium]MBU2040778.1 polysaccharide biosynthesis tyrosine autokinase [Alphaproteobacteria bacterium]MBU2207888.1 polysaccharide biosynthesis tyrosine autokinase [Alphaproteobacteria bacterium]MBU2291251.1 polysaccharide biosynthesis tyrosine autokinase [Alphaproteobacteria bacterium]MBU2396685.1 polysaccharide biosynthesis tyrosine autokinase [Alphaproteobacteria bacterium]